jgi:hypothetical protein
MLSIIDALLEFEFQIFCENLFLSRAQDWRVPRSHSFSAASLPVTNFSKRILRIRSDKDGLRHLFFVDRH